MIARLSLRRRKRPPGGGASEKSASRAGDAVRVPVERNNRSRSSEEVTAILGLLPLRAESLDSEIISFDLTGASLKEREQGNDIRTPG